MSYSRERWSEDKILVGLLIEKRHYAEAREMLTAIHLTTAPQDRDIDGFVQGALFMLDLLCPPPRGGIF